MWHVPPQKENITWPTLRPGKLHLNSVPLLLHVAQHSEHCIIHQAKFTLSMADATPVEEKQCRICLDSEVEELGRLIRPCLCKGSISVSHTSNQAITAVTHKHFTSQVRAREVPTAMEKFIPVFERLLFVPTMSLPLPFCPYPSIWNSHESR
jgi:hypothetical protein